MNTEIRAFKSHIKLAEASHTFYVRMQGDSMMEAGINDNDLLSVCSTKKPAEGDIVLIMVDNEFLVRRYFLDETKVVLMPENVNFPCVILDNLDNYEICGVVSL